MGFGPVNVPGSETAEIEAIRKLAQAASETANTAKNTAESAQETAEAALGAANEASSAAGDAQKTASEAKELAEGAGRTASEALETATAAQETANGVSGKADEALKAAENAQQSASSALEAVKKLTSTINAVPSQNGTLTYNGNPQTPSWNNYDPDQLTLQVAAQTNAGTYTATFTPKAGNVWADDETNKPKTVQWTIKRATVTLPVQSGTLTYTGVALNPTWNANYDANKMTLSVTAQINAGSYSASFTPKDNYQWSDGTYGAKTASWSIAKAAGSLSLNPASLKLDVSALSKTIAVTRAGDGAITAQSSNTAVAEVQLSGTTITVTGKAKGNVTITVKVAAGTNHNAPADQTASVEVELVSRTLADNTPASIKAVAAAGNGASYWSVGDKIGIKVNGSFGGLTYNDTVYAFILGFNHNESVEGKGIDFQFGKTAAGVDIAFVQDYGSTGKGFCMNTTNTNSGGWKDSYMNKTICPAFLSALPTDWQNAIANATKYSDNKGGGSDTAGNVSASQSKIWLLAEWEVFGARTGANSAEQNYQKQYTYYANGNSRVKYQHTSTGSACNWWLRSVYATNTTAFRYVYTSGSGGSTDAYSSYGFAPGFKVA